MKKVFVLVLLVSVFFSAKIQAQDFKAKGGAKNLELQMAPLGGTPLSISGLRFRYFLSDNSAFRVNFFLGYNKKTTVDSQADTAGSTPLVPQLNTYESGLTFNLRPGYEMHFTGTDRLSPYCGAELDFGMATSKKVVESPEMDGSSVKVVTTTTKGEKGYLRLGLNAVLGCDVYIVKSLYIGAEMGIGFQFNKESTITHESTIKGWNKNSDGPDEIQGKTIDFGPNVIGQFRIGYIF